MTDKPTILLWIDIETTDATPDAQRLELYACWTWQDNSRILAEYEELSPAKPRMKMAPEVEAMHRDSGLLEALDANWAPPTDADEWTRATLMLLWLENRRIAREFGAQVTIAGSGIAHFDVPWLRGWESGARLVADCNYWLLDVGILRRALSAAGLELQPDPTPKKHRAKADAIAHGREFFNITRHMQALQITVDQHTTHCMTPKRDDGENTGEDPQ